MFRRSKTTHLPAPSPRLFPVLRAGLVEIHGCFEGVLWSEGDVVIGRTARARGGIKGRHVLLQGKLDGKLHADGTVLLQKSARLEGQISGRLLVIEPGAAYRASCAVGDSVALNATGAGERGMVDAPPTPLVEAVTAPRLVESAIDTGDGDQPPLREAA